MLISISVINYRKVRKNKELSVIGDKNHLVLSFITDKIRIFALGYKRQD